MDVLSYKNLLLTASFSFFSLLADIPYYLKLGYQQAKLLRSEQSIEQALQDPKLSAEQKNKLQLIQSLRGFIEKDLSLKLTENYKNFVALDDKYVSYVVNAAPTDRLENFYFEYPIVGKMPYKGFPKKQDAIAFAEELKQKQQLDVYVRGVRAYSSLGWFKDPVFSSMLDYSEEDLVETIIHESIHATLYIKNHADFNERMANFMGQYGAILYYQKIEGKDSKTAQKIINEKADRIVFSNFLKSEYEILNVWYKKNYPKEQDKAQAKKLRLKELQNKFKTEVLSKMKTDSYQWFAEIEFNNAFLMLQSTYNEDMSLFEKVLQTNNYDYKKSIQFLMKLERAKDPQVELYNLLVK